MDMTTWAYRLKHIPGSLNINSVEQGAELLSPDDEIVVYCAGVSCIASVAAFQYLTMHGYDNVRRYAGGVTDWEERGYPFESEGVE